MRIRLENSFKSVLTSHQLIHRGLEQRNVSPKPRRINWCEVDTDFDEFARRMHLTEFLHDITTDNISNPFYHKSLWAPTTDRDAALN